jgi:hypothetical protein
MLQAFAVMLDKYLRTLRFGRITPCMTTWAVALQTGPVQLLSGAKYGAYLLMTLPANARYYPRVLHKMERIMNDIQ